MAAPALLTIGELARRTGLATSALRYYEELGLVPPPVRVSGQRRYSQSTVDLVGVILLLRDVGFSLTEIKHLFAAPDTRAEWRASARNKLDELDRQIYQKRVARVALEHVLRCRHDDLTQCPNFLGTIVARLAGEPLEAAHPR
ncbi:MAG: MerR family transcriptional regulator [Actinomycetota bacterium]